MAGSFCLWEQITKQIVLDFKEIKMKKIILLVLTVILTACSGRASTEFDKNLAKWQDAKVTHYRYTLFIGCFCAFTEDMPVTIEVNNGEIVSITSTNGNAINPGDAPYESVKYYADMDLLFNQLKDSLDKADKVEMTYDPTYGFPTSIAIDQVEQAVDDELYITVDNFEILK
jgi:hypothetical protein